MKVRTYARTSPEENQRERDHRDLARRIAEEGIVLLKNDGALPAAPGNIALYGAGVTKTIFGGSGSGEVDARKYVNVLEGFENAGYTVTTRSWLNDYEAEFEKEQKQFFHEMRTGFLKIRSGADANNILGASFVYPAGRAVNEEDVAASKTDTCLYVIARQSGEGSDRKPEEFVFLPEEIAQIRFCAEHYEKTVLVINVGASMDLTGVEEIPGLNAILFMCQLGEESGTALANVVSGAVSPSGHLTDTWVKNYDQVPFGNTFSFMSPDPLEQNYEEGIFVGYRYYQTAGVEPRYPFGFGLSIQFLLDIEGVYKNEYIKKCLQRMGLSVEFFVYDSYGLIPDIKASFDSFYELLPSLTKEKAQDILFEILKRVIEVKNQYSVEKNKRYFSEYIEKALVYIEDNLVDETLSIVEYW